MDMRKWMPVLAIGLIYCAGTAHASPMYSGTIVGVFTIPVLTGLSSDLGVLVPVDNSATAQYEGFGSNSIIWGIGSDPRNQVTFTGATFTGIQPDQVFKLGSLTYTNGSAIATTTISGATLTLSVNGALVTIDPAAARMGVIATINYGIDDREDADLLTFETFSQTFNVFESRTAVADLFGRIVGDPVLVINGIALAPGQEGNGFIGNGVFLAPEPFTPALFAIGLAGIGFSRRRQA